MLGAIRAWPRAVNEVLVTSRQKRRQGGARWSKRRPEICLGLEQQYTVARQEWGEYIPLVCCITLPPICPVKFCFLRRHCVVDVEPTRVCRLIGATL